MSEKIQHIVRIAGHNLDGSANVAYALTSIKGVGKNFARLVTLKAGIDPNARLISLLETDLKKLEDVLRNPEKYNLPAWSLNRRKDLESGKDIHLIGADLDLRVKMDIDLMKQIKCWKGVRHAYGLKVRGQRTKTTGRKGKAVGVRRRSARRG